MADAITQATKQVVELAKFRVFLAVRSMERFVFELEEQMKTAEIPLEDRRKVFARLSSEATQTQMHPTSLDGAANVEIQSQSHAVGVANACHFSWRVSLVRYAIWKRINESRLDVV